MQTLLATLVALLPCAVWAGSMQLPVGKCRYPLPNYPGLNATTVEGEVFNYIYTPSAMVYRAVDNIKMKITKAKAKEEIYTEQIRAVSILGTQTNMKFSVKYLGDGILEKITKEGETSYIASIVAIKGDVGMLYVCSNDGEETGEDYRYIIARKHVKPETIKHPDIMFKAVTQKYKFTGKFRRLPQRLHKKGF